MPTFTIFTPTFNRAHTLPRVYQSLLAQTCQDFEWVIVDDGSDDNTRDLVADWIKEAPFRITYAHQENRGKHAAFNHGVRLAKADLFVPADSDDEYLPDALSIFKKYWFDIPESERHRFTGITCLCMNTKGSVIGDSFPSSPFDSDALENHYRHKLRGEKWGCHKTAVLRDFPFPELAGATFVPEDLIWHAIARRYKMRCINDALRVYHQDSGNQIMKSSRAAKCGGRIGYSELINQDIDYFWVAPLIFLKYAVLYCLYSYLSGDTLKEQTSRLEWPGKLLWLLTLIPGTLWAISVKLADK